jgi:hypothetical protein
MIEDQEVEFMVATRGSATLLKGIRILRSPEPGIWENGPIVPIEKALADEHILRYRLTDRDVGCVIRALLMTEDGSSPLMVTSQQRVRAAPPRFSQAEIIGNVTHLPLYLFASYHGGVQGRCRYNWSISEENSPMIFPGDADKGKIVSCQVTPLRQDGSIGEPIVVRATAPLRQGRRTTRKYVVVEKKTSHGRLLLGIVDNPVGDGLAQIPEGESLTVRSQMEWIAFAHGGMRSCGTSKIFRVPEGLTGSLLIVAESRFYAVVGQVVLRRRAVSAVAVAFEPVSGVLRTSEQWVDGVEGRCEIHWMKSGPGQASKLAGISPYRSVEMSDQECQYVAMAVPLYAGGEEGDPVSSEPFVIEERHLPIPETERIVLTPPATVLEDQQCFVRFPGKG